MILEEALSNFRKFILHNYEFSSSVLSEELMADWLQANWEIIVEGNLHETGLINSVIDIYGEGADCNGASSRVSMPNRIPTQSVHVVPNFIFHSFGTLRENYYIQIPPFDYVKAVNSKNCEIIKPIDDVVFSIGASFDSIST